MLVADSAAGAAGIVGLAALGWAAGLVPASEASSGTAALSGLGMSGADSGAPPSRAGSPQVSSGAAGAGDTGGAGSGATSRAGSGVGGEGDVASGFVASSGDCTDPESTSDFASFGVCPDSAGSGAGSDCAGSACSTATGLVDSASCAAVSWASPSLPASPASCSGFHTGFGLSVSKPNAFGLVPTSHRISSSNPVVSKTALWIVALCSGALSREASAPVLCPRTSVSSAIPKGWAPVRRMPATALVFDTVERILSQAFLMVSVGGGGGGVAGCRPGGGGRRPGFRGFLGFPGFRLGHCLDNLGFFGHVTDFLGFAGATLGGPLVF